MLKAFNNLTLLVTREASQFWPPTGFQLQGNARSINNGRTQKSGQVLLKRVFLQCQVAEKIGILLDVFGNLFNQSSTLPCIIYKADSLLQTVSYCMNRRNYSKPPSQVSEYFEFSFTKTERSVSIIGHLGQMQQVGDLRTVFLGFLVLRGNTDTGSCKQLPPPLWNVPGSKDLIQK